MRNVGPHLALLHLEHLPLGRLATKRARFVWREFMFVVGKGKSVVVWARQKAGTGTATAKGQVRQAVVGVSSWDKDVCPTTTSTAQA